jgi:hypothetical protein
MEYSRDGIEEVNRLIDILNEELEKTEHDVISDSLFGNGYEGLNQFIIPNRKDLLEKSGWLTLYFNKAVELYRFYLKDVIVKNHIHAELDAFVGDALLRNSEINTIRRPLELMASMYYSTDADYQEAANVYVKNRIGILSNDDFLLFMQSCSDKKQSIDNELHGYSKLREVARDAVNLINERTGVSITKEVRLTSPTPITEGDKPKSNRGIAKGATRANPAKDAVIAVATKEGITGAKLQTKIKHLCKNCLSGFSSDAEGRLQYLYSDGEFYKFSINTVKDWKPS